MVLHGANADGLHFGPKKRMPPASVFGPSPRRFNLITIGFNIFVPWLLFTALYAVMSFSMHYRAPSVAWLLVSSSFGVVIIAGLLAFRAKRNCRDPLWYGYFATACLVAIVVATIAGNANYTYNMRPFYQIETMNMYPAVNPAHEKGSQLMDAGRIHFAEGTGIDMRRAMGFRNFDLFCVAPIVIGNEKMASYDFWAVGTNCCSGVSSDFRCGGYNNPKARSGLRLMSDQDRPFYRLAVQQAEAAYNIKSTHPIFFYWMEDPLDEINKYQETGFKEFFIGFIAYLTFNTFCVAATVISFASGSIGGEGSPKYGGV